MSKKLLVFQHVEREHPSNIALYAKEHGMGLDIVRISETADIPDIASYDALVVMGGSMGAYEDYPGKEAELAAIREAIGTMPVLGICLGSQLLAYALGAKVYPYMVDGKRVKEVGYGAVELTDEGKASPLFRGLPSPLTVLQWHGDTFELPDGATLLATNSVCRNQAFSKGNAFGVQFHVEVTPELVAEWVADDGSWAHTDHDMNDGTVVADAKKYAEHMKRQCFALMDNFLGA